MINKIIFLFKTLIELTLMISIYIRILTKKDEYKIYSDLNFAKYCLLVTLVCFLIELGYQYI